MASGLAVIQEELKREISKPYDSSDAVLQCGTAALSIIQSRPDDVLRLAHAHLHSFPYLDVPECWRRLYTDAALWKAVNLKPVDGQEAKFVEVLDMAVILTGAPLRQPLIQDIFSNMAQDDTLDLEAIPHPANALEHRVKRQKVFHDLNRCSNIPTSFPQPSFKPFTLDHPIPRKHNMTLTSFQAQLNADHQRNNLQGALPLILTNAISHWPALSNTAYSWDNPRYWLKATLDGHRLVPIEVGRAYTDDDWSQKIIPFKTFMENYLLPEIQADPSQPETTTKQGTGYLAQHDLFTQIPSLRADILIPDFCYSAPPSLISHNIASASASASSSEDETTDDPIMNIWLGPASTTSPLHTDPHHNILAQVFGHKYVRLYGPSETEKLYPRSKEGDVDMSNTSRVDVGLGLGIHSEESEDTNERRRLEQEFEAEFPLFRDAAYVEGILGPAECLFIPRGWWHYVRSLSPSCSVSFWWD